MSALDELRRALESRGWPLVHVGSLRVGPGEPHWRDVLSRADDVQLAALAGALAVADSTGAAATGTDADDPADELDDQGDDAAAGDA